MNAHYLMKSNASAPKNPEKLLIKLSCDLIKDSDAIAEALEQLKVYAHSPEAKINIICQLAYAYKHGIGKIQPNILLAIEYYTLAANRGSYKALIGLGAIYRNNPLKKDNRAAIDWYLQACLHPECKRIDALPCQQLLALIQQGDGYAQEQFNTLETIKPMLFDCYGSTHEKNQAILLVLHEILNSISWAKKNHCRIIFVKARAILTKNISAHQKIEEMIRFFSPYFQSEHTAFRKLVQAIFFKDLTKLNAIKEEIQKQNAKNMHCILNQAIDPIKHFHHLLIEIEEKKNKLETQQQAYYELGTIFLEGIVHGLPRLSAAAYCFFKAIKNYSSPTFLTKWLDQVTSLNRNALNELQKLEKRNCADAAFFLAVIYSHGKGVKAKPAEAKKYFDRANTLNSNLAKKCLDHLSLSIPKKLAPEDSFITDALDLAKISKILHAMLETAFVSDPSCAQDRSSSNLSQVKPVQPRILYAFDEALNFYQNSVEIKYQLVSHAIHALESPDQYLRKATPQLWQLCEGLKHIDPIIINGVYSMMGLDIELESENEFKTKICETYPAPTHQAEHHLNELKHILNNIRHMNHDAPISKIFKILDDTELNAQEKIEHLVKLAENASFSEDICQYDIPTRLIITSLKHKEIPSLTLNPMQKFTTGSKKLRQPKLPDQEDKKIEKKQDNFYHL